jgi:hypothetical protein
MPYSIDRKNKCIYKKKSDGSRGEKVGYTKGNLEDYIAAVQMHKEYREMIKKPINEQEEKMIPGAITQLYAVKKPYVGCQLTSLIEPIDPLLGIGAGHEVVGDNYYAVFADEDMANDVAADIFEDYQKQQKALEEKKDFTIDKIKKVLDDLEKKRKELMDAVKENPKAAQQHKDGIARITDKIDDLITKLEKVQKSKKEETTNKKDK